MFMCNTCGSKDIISTGSKRHLSEEEQLIRKLTTRAEKAEATASKLQRELNNEIYRKHQYAAELATARETVQRLTAEREEWADKVAVLEKRLADSDGSSL